MNEGQGRQTVVDRLVDGAVPSQREREAESGMRESAVGRLLREAGVGPGRDAEIGMREAERRTGVSRQTLAAWLAPIDPDNPIRHTKKNLELVARGLGIDRAALGMASMIDNNHGREVPTDPADDPVLAELQRVRTQLRALEDDVSRLIAAYVSRG